jgi:transcriptional regulator with XRE-family HTH domain
MAEAGWTQQRLSEASGVSVATIREVCHGRARRRHPRTLAALSEALGWPAGHLDGILTGQHPEPGSDALAAVWAELAAIRARLDALERRSLQ